MSPYIAQCPLISPNVALYRPISPYIVLHLTVPLVGFLGDRFRARKLILCVMLLVLFISTLAPLLPLDFSLPTCFAKPSEASADGTRLLATEYIPGNVDIYRNISLNGSSNAFLFRRNEELDSQLFPKRASPPKISTTTAKEVKQNTFVPWLSTLFVFMAIVRSLFSLTERTLLSLVNVATITYLKERRASYGSYFMWIHIGASVSLFSVGLLASHFTLSICGVIGDGYFITFVWAPAVIMVSSFAVPWFKYEYIEHRVMNWTEVKSIFSDIHYVFLLINPGLLFGFSNVLGILVHQRALWKPDNHGSWWFNPATVGSSVVLSLRTPHRKSW